MNTGIKAVVLGAGSWGTALALTLAKNGHKVTLWGKEEEIERISHNRENPLLPGVYLDEGIGLTFDLAEAMTSGDIVILAVPAQALREVLTYAGPFIPEKALVVNTAKGLEVGSNMRLSSVVEDVMGKKIRERYAVLSGPTHAEEVARQIPSAIVVAAYHSHVAYKVQEVFMSPVFRVYTNPDVIGVEMGGALKNIIALGTGVAEGLGLGDNTQAALLTRGLTEIARLGVAMGAQAITFAGLSGVGDLVVTCGSRHSRNRRCGILIGQGIEVEEAMARIGMVVEGVTTTQAAYELSRQMQVEMPITEGIYQLLYRKAEPREILSELMTRSRKHESEEVVKIIKDW